MADETCQQDGYVNHQVAESEAIPKRHTDFGDCSSRFLRAHSHTEIVSKCRNALRVDQIDQKKPSGYLQYPK